MIDEDDTGGFTLSTLLYLSGFEQAQALMWEYTPAWSTAFRRSKVLASSRDQFLLNWAKLLQTYADSEQKNQVKGTDIEIAKGHWDWRLHKNLGAPKSRGRFNISNWKKAQLSCRNAKWWLECTTSQDWFLSLDLRTAVGTSKPHHCISASELIRNDGKVLKLKSTHIASFKKSMQENTRISSPCTNFRHSIPRNGDTATRLPSKNSQGCTVHVHQWDAMHLRSSLQGTVR